MKKTLDLQKPFPAAGMAAWIGLAFLAASLTTGCNPAGGTTPAPNDTATVIGEYTADLTHAPRVPAIREYVKPEKVIVNLEVVEKVMKLADGVTYTF